MKAHKARIAAPQQARSRESERRLLDAAERLIEDRSLDKISMTEIAIAAGISIGGMYGRFPSKDHLLAALHERYEVDRAETLTAALHPEQWTGRDMEARLDGMANAIVTLFRKRRGVLRTFLLRYWADMSQLSDASDERLRGVYQNAYELIADCVANSEDEDAQAAIRFSVTSMIAVARESIIFKPAGGPGAVGLDDQALAESLAQSALSFLRMRLLAD